MDAFNAVDTNKDGAISMDETSAWVKANKNNLDDAAIKTGFEKMDMNKNGTIEKGEFDSTLK